MIPARERPSVSSFISEKTQSLEADAKEGLDALKAEIEEGFRVLKACPEGRGALLYFLHDVSRTPVANEIAGAEGLLKDS